MSHFEASICPLYDDSEGSLSEPFYTRVQRRPMTLLGGNMALVFDYKPWNRWAVTGYKSSARPHFESLYEHSTTLYTNLYERADVVYVEWYQLYTYTDKNESVGQRNTPTTGVPGGWRSFGRRRPSCTRCTEGQIHIRVTHDSNTTINTPLGETRNDMRL
jgi:hypothetical protein